MKKFLFPGIAFWLLLLIPLTFWAFYDSYFSKLTSVPPIFHLHAIFMLLWIGLAVIQPLLIYRKKTKLHIAVGKFSYLLMPLIILTTWMMMHTAYSFYFNNELKSLVHLTEPERSSVAAISAGHQVRIGILYWFSLMAFYIAGISFRKQTAYHATFMFAATLTLLGPIVDRIVFPIAQEHFPALAEINVAFILIDLLLIALLIYQFRKKVKVAATVFSLILYLSWQWWFYHMPELELWSMIIKPPFLFN